MRSTFGKRAASSITKSEIIDWLAAEAQRRGWRPASRNRYQAAISLCFRVAVDDGKLSVNPAARIKRLREDNQRVRFLTPEEELALVAVIERRFPKYVDVVRLAIHTGARASELLRGRVGDYNPQTGKLTIRQKKVRHAPPARHVPLTPIGVGCYERLAGDRKVGEPLCTKIEKGQLMDTRYWFDPCAEEAGLVDFTWHDLRHTAASRWVMGGVPLAAVAAFLGHQTIGMTMRYTHLQPRNDTQAIDVMMSYYGTGSEPAAPGA